MKDEELANELLALRGDAAFRNLTERLQGFDPFKVLKVERYELRHTTTLSWLLDPHETHGLGDDFLRFFLTEVFGDTEDAALFLRSGDSPLAPVAVQPELKLQHSQSEASANPGPLIQPSAKRARKTGELDVLIESERWAVAIEAKIDSKEGVHQLRDYRDYLTERFARNPDFQLRLLYLTVQEEPEVQEANPDWIGVQWGRQVARALDQALAKRYHADPSLAFDACAPKQRPLCEFLYRYRSLLQRLTNALYGMEDDVQALADQYNRVLLALDEGVRRRTDGELSIVPWLSSPCWVGSYWADRRALDVLMAHARSPEAHFTADVMRRLVRHGGRQVMYLSPERGKAATIRFAPEEWERRVDINGKATPLHRMMFYHMEFRDHVRNPDIEIKLFLPEVAEHVSRAILIDKIVGPSGRRPDHHISPRSKHLKDFMTAPSGTLKLFTLSLYWEKRDDGYALKPGEEQKLDEFWEAVGAHETVLREALGGEPWASEAGPGVE